MGSLAVDFLFGQVGQDPQEARSFGHCLVAGVDRAPLKVTRRFGRRLSFGRFVFVFFFWFPVEVFFVLQEDVRLLLIISSGF